MDEMTRAPQIFLRGALCRDGMCVQSPGGDRRQMSSTDTSNAVRSTAPVSSTLM